MLTTLSDAVIKTCALFPLQCSGDDRHEGTLMELKKMFTYLLESERKAYNPFSFCKVYTMDHQPLNTGEQKDMTEFFTDLITKLEEMGSDLVRSCLSSPLPLKKFDDNADGVHWWLSNVVSCPVVVVHC